MRGGGLREVSSSSPLRAASVSSPWSAGSSSVRRTSAKDRFQNVRCFKPYIGATRLAFPCGQCLACRINKRRIWSHRIMLESMQYAENAFVTLTYGESAPRSVEPGVLSGWVKRLRERLEPRRIRHFSVGEYGDKSGRPHYHSAVFGSGCAVGPYVLMPGGGRECRCQFCSVVRSTWTVGFSSVGVLTEQSAAYIAGYVVKKMTKKGDIALQGRLPEFARMSLRPGIGAFAVPDIASVMLEYSLQERGDVPVGLRHGSKVKPLGRYLRKLLRLQVGLDEKAPPEVIEALREGLLPVWQYADVVCSAPGMARLKRPLVEQALEQCFEQQARNAAAKGLIYEKREI